MHIEMLHLKQNMRAQPGEVLVNSLLDIDEGKYLDKYDIEVPSVCQIVAASETLIRHNCDDINNLNLW